jgi:glucose/mannose-6-phosphate isomerase
MEIEQDTLNFINMFENKKNYKLEDRKGRILISGMGGSGIGGLIASALSNQIGNQQVIPWANYGLPKWVNKNDRIICISYSGNTAETLSAAKKAIDIGSKLEVITTGGELEKLAIQNNLNITKIEKGHQPRAALPLLLKPLLYKIGIPDLDKQLAEISTLKNDLKKAREIARQIDGKLPCIYSNGLLTPVGYRWRCQIEENSKVLAINHEIPEMNHNEIVGWTNPLENMAVILIRDNMENETVKKRINATKTIAWTSKGINITEVYAIGKYPLTRIISMILLGDLVSIELAKLKSIDPTPVQIIENLKEALGGN